MRRFALGSGSDRKVVVIELDGPRMTVAELMPDGEMKRTRQELSSDQAARAASDQMARQLTARGFKERVARGARPERAKVRASKAQADAGGPEGPSPFDDIEPAAAASVVLPRLAAAPNTAAGPTPKKTTGGKKKRKEAKGGDALDKRVLAGIGAFLALFLGGIAFLAYDAFLKPATIVGVWSGSMLEHVISRKLTVTRYDLILDAQRHASLTLQQKYTTTGTYSLKGDHLKLSLRDEDGAEDDREYKIVLGHVTLELKDPQTDELVVQLLRSRDQPAIAGKPAPAPAAPSNLGEADATADADLASVDFAAKDSAFRLRYPQGWDHDTGGRPDNTFSWIRLTKGSATIEVNADVKGSLLSGSDVNRQPQEGSETAPVHVAHEDGKKSTAQGFSNYSESEPAVFKGAKLGEGRIAQFSASTGALFGSKIRGYRVTLLTNDRRVTILCQCPDKEFAKYRPTFLAVARSLAR